MGKNLLVGVGGKARKVKALYVGVGGKARKVKKVYVGVGGKARLVYQSYIPVTGVKLEIASTKDLTCIIKAVFTPANATNLSVKWTIRDQFGIDISAKYATTCTLTVTIPTTVCSCMLTATTPDGVSCTKSIAYAKLWGGVGESNKLKSSNSNSDDSHYFLSGLNYGEVSWTKFQNGGEKPWESKAILSPRTARRN